MTFQGKAHHWFRIAERLREGGWEGKSIREVRMVYEIVLGKVPSPTLTKRQMAVAIAGEGVRLSDELDKMEAAVAVAARKR